MKQASAFAQTARNSNFFSPLSGNIFLDAEGNVRLGDFGLATRKRHGNIDDDDGSESQFSEAAADYEAIEDISRLMGGSAQASQHSSAQESMTGGVGASSFIQTCSQPQP